MITVYTIAYNEELIMQFMIDHYRSRFPGCNIVVYDNMSTDNTTKIARANDCEVIQYDTNNQIQDRRYIEIKNNCWKNALTDWVLICDMDELLDINAEQLKKEEEVGVTMIRARSYDMINMEDNLDIKSIKYGARASRGYDKLYLFNKKFVKEINYEPGCHKCNPVGDIIFSNDRYNLYHYAFINENYIIEKYKRNMTRLSPENIKRGWARHYSYNLEQIHAKYERIRSQAIKLFN